MEYETLIFEKKEHIATITLNRPAKLNAYNSKMTEELKLAIQAAEEDDEIKVIILTGAGRGFCTGHDVDEARESYPAKRKREVIQMRLADDYAPLSLMDTDKPLIGAINGVATGGGLAMALACDIRIASEKAIFFENHVVAVASTPGLETWLLPRLVGPERALEMIYTGRRISAQEAERIGLVSKVVPHDSLMKEAWTLASKIAEANLLALKLSKKMFYIGLQENIGTTMDYVQIARGHCLKRGYIDNFWLGKGPPKEG